MIDFDKRERLIAHKFLNGLTSEEQEELDELNNEISDYCQRCTPEMWSRLQEIQIRVKAINEENRKIYKELGI